jgi:uroporphyrinogen decarboxylase
MNEKFQNALARVPQAVPPIWFMRQAGRYHTHYQALRQKHSFMELCKNADLAAEVALGPIRDFDFDVSILFSDLLFPLEAMGMGLKYDPAPELEWHLTPETIRNLRPHDEALQGLQFQKLAMQKTRTLLPDSKSLIGFVGGPWTLFTYAVEGAHKGGLEKSKSLIRLFPKFCETLLPLLESNIQLQLEGGAEVVMIFDTAAGELSPQFYKSEVVPTLSRLQRAFQNRLGYYAKGVQAAHLQHPLFAPQSPWAGLGFDHRWFLPEVLKNYKCGFVQGNFDQSLLFLEPSEFENWAMRYLETFRGLSLTERTGWVSGLGHGVLPGTLEVNVRRFVKMIREVLA